MSSYIQGWPLFWAGLLQCSQHSRCVLQQLRGEEKNFISMSLNLSNRGGNIRNFLKQSWGSSKCTERLREREMIVFVSLGKYCAEMWDWIWAKLSWMLLCRALLSRVPQLFPVPPSISLHYNFLGRRPNLFCRSLHRNIHTFEFKYPNATSVVSYKTKAQSQGVINKIWLTKSQLLVHLLSWVHFAFPPWSHQAAAWRNNLNVILTLYQF